MNKGKEEKKAYEKPLLVKHGKLTELISDLIKTAKI